MKFGVIVKDGLESCMRATRRIELFIIFRTKIDRASTVIDGYVIDSSFGEGLRVTHALKVALSEDIIVASSNDDLKATSHIL